LLSKVPEVAQSSLLNRRRVNLIGTRLKTAPLPLNSPWNGADADFAAIKSHGGTLPLATPLIACSMPSSPSQPVLQVLGPLAMVSPSFTSEIPLLIKRHLWIDVYLTHKDICHMEQDHKCDLRSCPMYEEVTTYGLSTPPAEPQDHSPPVNAMYWNRRELRQEWEHKAPGPLEVGQGTPRARLPPSQAHRRRTRSLPPRLPPVLMRMRMPPYFRVPHEERRLVMARDYLDQENKVPVYMTLLKPAPLPHQEAKQPERSGTSILYTKIWTPQPNGEYHVRVAEIEPVFKSSRRHKVHWDSDTSPQYAEDNNKVRVVNPEPEHLPADLRQAIDLLSEWTWDPTDGQSGSFQRTTRSLPFEFKPSTSPQPCEPPWLTNLTRSLRSSAVDVSRRPRTQSQTKSNESESKLPFQRDNRAPLRSRKPLKTTQSASSTGSVRPYTSNLMLKLLTVILSLVAAYAIGQYLSAAPTVLAVTMLAAINLSLLVWYVLGSAKQLRFTTATRNKREMPSSTSQNKRKEPALADPRRPKRNIFNV
jgi:hypothetical protein